MKKKIAMLLIGMMALTGCSAGEKSEVPGEKQQLVISTWGLSEDILHEEIYDPFEEAFNCEIVLEVGTTAERYTKFSTDPNSKIDLIDLSQSKAAEGREAGLFESIDYSKVKNSQFLIPAASAMTANGEGPASTLNSIGIIYDKEAVGFEITEFADLWKPELKGKISIPELTTTFGPAMMYVASDFKGVDISSDDGAAAFKALEELKPNIVKTYAKSSDLANMFASGEITVAVVGDFAIPTISAAAPQVTYVTPASGTYANFNTIEISAKSKNKDLAYEFINWRISKELQTATADKLNESPTNSEVVLSEEQAKNKTYGEVAKAAKSIDYSFVNPLMTKWIDSWNRILNN